MIFKPEDFGTVGQGDDTAALQGAIDAVRQDHKGVVEISRGLNIGAINATDCSNLEIECEIGAVHTCTVLAEPAPILDLIDSHNLRISQFVLTGNTNDFVIPRAAFLFSSSDKATLERCTVNGRFSSSIFSNIGASSISVRDCQFIQYDPIAPCVTISTQPDWWITSLFKTLVPSVNAPDVYFEQSELHQLALEHAQWTVYMRNADHIVFDGGLVSNNTRAHMLMQGTCSRISSIGQKFYSELGGNAEMVFESGGGTVDHLHIFNPSFNEGYVALTGGSGTFPNLSVT